MSKFQEVLKNNIDGIVTLPLLHTCDAFSLRGILEKKRLIPQKCDVFENSKLLYTYYGVPSYRLKFEGSTLNPAYHIICIILETSNFKDIHKIFPFDTGSFVKFKEIKETYFHHKTEVLDFELDNNINSAKKVIKTFYNSNKNYLAKTPQHSLDQFSQFDFEAIAYSQLISEKNHNKFDDRESSIEIIFDKELDVNSATVKQLIIPNRFADDKKIMSLIEKNLGIENPIVYDTVRGNPNEYIGLIRSKYLEFINDTKL